jgi:hypothetical protein
MFSATKGGSPSGYQISRSVRLRSSASAYFNRTLTTPTSSQKFTWSGWTKRGKLDSSGLQGIFCPYSSGTVYGYLAWYQDGIRIFDRLSGGTNYLLQTTAVYRDPSAWYHIVYAVDTTQATAANRVRLYVNGVEVTLFSTSTYPTQNNSTTTNSAIAHNIGYDPSNVGYLDGYLTETNFIDGQALTPASFGETNPVTGVWQPKKYAGTYGTNGFYLNFSDNSAATAAAIGADYSGNGNDWTPNNISVTAGVTYDSMLDVPTLWADGGNGRGNYAVANPINAASGLTVSDGNLKIAASAVGSKFVNSSIALPSSGAYYAEITFANASTSNIGQTIGIALASRSLTAGYNVAGSYHFYASNTGSLLSNGTETGGLSAISANEVFQVAVDVTNSKMWIGRSNVWYNSTGGTTGDPSTGANPTFTAAFADFFAFAGFDTTSAVSANFNFGQRPFAYTPPTGFKALNTGNLPEPTILKGNQYFDATLWDGNSTDARVITTNVGTVDFAWVKKRNGADDHRLANTVTGGNRHLQSNTTAVESTGTTVIQAFSGSTFTLGTDNSVNATGGTYVGWTWKANGTPAVTNTAGSITSQVSAGANQGFSIVTYTGTGANATVGHGLGVAPKMIITKPRNSADNWISWHTSLGATGYIYLNNTNASATGAAVWNSTLPSSTVFSIGTSSNINSSGQTQVAYCFSEVAGFSKFGSYTGNGSTDGPFVFCGFRPRFVLVKQSSSSGNNWVIYDTARDTYNECDSILYPNLANAEFSGTTVNLDILSNGFKPRDNWGGNNQSGSTYIYAAFAENPFKNALAR